MTDEAELDAYRVDMLRELTKLNAEIAALQGDVATIKADLRRLPVGDYTVSGHPALRIAPTRRFDPALGLSLVPAELRAGCYTITLDPKLVKKYLAPALVEAAMVEVGEVSVRVL